MGGAALLAQQGPQDLQPYFSPNGGCTEAVLNALGAAKQSVLVESYTLATNPFAEALVEAKKRGVDVQVILDKSQKTNQLSPAPYLTNSGIPTYIDTAHKLSVNKIMVIDGNEVISNAESLIIISHAPKLAQTFTENWKAHLAHAESYSSGQSAIPNPNAQTPSINAKNDNLFADLLADNTATNSQGEANSISNSTNNVFAKLNEKLAKIGDATAQFNLGLDFLNGTFQKKDPQEAFKWFLKSAEQGYVGAEHNLGWMCDNGVGTEKNSKEAAKWYEMAANQGDAQAQNIIGQMYSEGDGVEKSDALAAKWYKKAVAQGDAQGAVNLGFLYFNGTGVPQSHKEAYQLFQKASDGGNVLATQIVGTMYVNGQGVKKNYTLANKYLKKAADQGDCNSMIMLGDNFRIGLGVPVNYKTAYSWYMKAAMLADSAGQGKVGMMYDMGYGVIKDQIEALAWYYLACRNNDQRLAGMINYRNTQEAKLGTAAALAAQQRSKEIEASLQAKPVAPNQRSQSSEIVGCSGSGVVILPDGLILTANHVVNGANQIMVQTPSGKFPAKVVHVDASNDLALIKCEGQFKASPIAPSKDIQLGQSVFTIGFPNIDLQGYSPKLTKGEISSMNGVQDDPREWQISAPVQPGNSGGPLFDDKGNVIGIVLAKLNAVKMVKYTGDVPENVGYAIKSSYILPLLDQFSSNLSPPNSSAAATVDLVKKVEDSVVLILCSGSKPTGR
jgi:TPR repeat protein